MKLLFDGQASPTLALAQFAARTQYADLPPSAIARAKVLLRDYIGVAVAGACNSEFASAMARFFISQGGRPEVSVILHDAKLPAMNAAFVDAVMGHVLDLDDGHRYGTVHAGVDVMPAALTVAEYAGASGRELLRAIVVGYEVLLRLASAINPSHLARGFHTTGTCGPFGAAVACAILLGLDPEQMHNAIGLAGLQGAGLQEMLHSAQEVKPLQPGRAAQAGVFSAFLGRDGIRGPKSVLEGEHGFIKAMTDHCDYDRMFARLGEFFEIENTYIKLYPTCRHVHPPLDLALAMRDKFKIDPVSIQSIRVLTHSVAIRETGDIHVPDSPVAAQFSIPYAVAVALVTGRAGIAEFRPPWISDPRVLAISRKVEVVLDQERDARYPAERGAELQIILQNGERFTMQTSLPKGEPETPASESELLAKFEYCTAESFSPARREKIVQVVDHLEQHDDVRALTTMLAKS